MRAPRPTRKPAASGRRRWRPAPIPGYPRGVSPMPSPILCALAFAACALALPAPAALAAAPPPIEAVPLTVLSLEVTRDRGSARCPDAVAIAGRVGARLSRNPFVAAAERKVRVAFAKKTKVYSARLAIDPPPGRPDAAARELISARSCDELADAVAIAIALTIGPELNAPLIARPRRPLDPTSVTKVVRRAGPDVAAPPRLRGHLSAGVGAGFGLSPGASLLSRLGVGVNVSGWRATIFFLSAFLGAKDLDGASVEGTLLAGELELCRDVHPLELCAVGAAGSSAFSGSGITAPAPGSVAWVSLGPRVNLRWFSSRSVALLLTAELDFPLVRARLRVDDELVWRTPVVAGAITLGARFPL